MKKMWILLSCFWSFTAWAATSTSPISGAKSSSLEAEFSAQLKEQLSQRMNLQSDLFDVEVSNLMIVPPVSNNSKIELLEIFALGSSGSSRVDGLLSIPANIRIDSKSIEEVTLSGVVKVTGPVWVASAALVRDQVVSEESITLTKMPWSRLPSNAFLTSQSDLVGRALRRSVSRGGILYSGILKGRSAVKIGASVVLTVQSGPGVMIRSRAFAKEAGSVGDFIKVEQPETKKILQAVITGPNKVEVQL